MFLWFFSSLRNSLRNRASSKLSVLNADARALIRATARQQLLQALQRLLSLPPRAAIAARALPLASAPGRPAPAAETYPATGGPQARVVPWFDHVTMNLPASAVTFLDVFNGLYSPAPAAATDAAAVTNAMTTTRSLAGLLSDYPALPAQFFGPAHAEHYGSTVPAALAPWVMAPVPLTESQVAADKTLIAAAEAAAATATAAGAAGSAVTSVDTLATDAASARARLYGSSVPTNAIVTEGKATDAAAAAAASGPRVRVHTEWAALLGLTALDGPVATAAPSGCSAGDAPTGGYGATVAVDAAALLKHVRLDTSAPIVIPQSNVSNDNDSSSNTAASESLTAPALSISQSDSGSDSQSQSGPVLTVTLAHLRAAGLRAPTVHCYCFARCEADWVGDAMRMGEEHLGYAVGTPYRRGSNGNGMTGDSVPERADGYLVDAPVLSNVNSKDGKNNKKNSTISRANTIASVMSSSSSVLPFASQQTLPSQHLDLQQPLDVQSEPQCLSQAQSLGHQSQWSLDVCADTRDALSQATAPITVAAAAAATAAAADASATATEIANEVALPEGKEMFYQAAHRNVVRRDVPGSKGGNKANAQNNNGKDNKSNAAAGAGAANGGVATIYDSAVMLESLERYGVYVHDVRNVAPLKQMMCISFRLREDILFGLDSEFRGRNTPSLLALGIVKDEFRNGRPVDGAAGDDDD